MSPQILSISNSKHPQVPVPQFALWQLGFRPFYLVASVFSALSIALWALQFQGYLPVSYLGGALWHAHEMLFGFALAVIVGFLFTAVRNWTNQPTPTGVTLMLLVLLWFAGRVLVLTPYAWVSAGVNAAFPLACAGALIRPLWRAGSKRNYFFVGLLVIMASANLMIHLAQLQVLAFSEWVGVRLMLSLVLFVICVIGGRVIPMFTNNGVLGAGAERLAWVEKTALGATLVWIVMSFFANEHLLLMGVAALCCVAHTVRWLLWRPWKTGNAPLVWVLHGAYAWIPAYFALSVAAELGLVTASVATHALTSGAMGAMIIGMMTRTARGHTGRNLRADKFDVACYLAVFSAAIIRVGLPLLMPQMLLLAVLLSAVLWTLGFALFVVRYGPSLLRAREDGKAG